MSFVYAINDVIFSIMSDTKIEPNYDRLKLWNTESEYNLEEIINLALNIHINSKENAIGFIIVL